MTIMLGSTLISPILPTLQDTFDVPTASIGLVLTMFSLPGLLFAPLVGIFADRFGRRAVIVPMLFLYGIAGGLTALAPDFETLLVMRFLAGLGGSAVSFLTITLVGDLFAREHRATVLGFRIAAGQTASLILPPIAGALVLIGWQYPFLIYFLAVPVGIFTLLVLEAGEKKPAQSVGDYFRAVAGALRDKRLAGILTVAPTLMIVGQGAVAAYIPIFMASHFGASALVIGLVHSARIAAGITSAMSVGRLNARFGGERLTIAAILVMASGLVWVPFAGSVGELVLPSVIIGLGSGAAFPAFQTLLVNEAPEDMLAAVTVANGMTNRFGQTTGPLLAGALFAAGDINAVFFGAAAFLGAMAIFYFFLFRRAPVSG
jgi:ACDE family multidrug resistance protein